MDIFILNLEEFLLNVDKEFLTSFLEEKNFKSEARKNQFCAGRFLTKYTAENFYTIENTEIGIKNKKPFFKNNSLNFNISHSQNQIAVAFDENELGFDIEYMKERDFAALLKRYNVPAESAKDIFYRFWTEYEAKLKLHSNLKTLTTMKYMNEYMMGFASSQEIDIEKKLKLYELKCTAENSFEFTEIKNPSLEFFEALNVPV